MKLLKKRISERMRLASARPGSDVEILQLLKKAECTFNSIGFFGIDFAKRIVSFFRPPQLLPGISAKTALETKCSHFAQWCAKCQHRSTMEKQSRMGQSLGDAGPYTGNENLISIHCFGAQPLRKSMP